MLQQHVIVYSTLIFSLIIEFNSRAAEFVFSFIGDSSHYQQIELRLS